VTLLSTAASVACLTPMPPGVIATAPETEPLAITDMTA
jgi:hypothetical protein